MAFFHSFSKYVVFRRKQILSTDKMINISESLGTSHFVDRTRTHYAKL